MKQYGKVFYSHISIKIPQKKFLANPDIHVSELIFMNDYERGPTLPRFAAEYLVHEVSTGDWGQGE